MTLLQKTLSIVAFTITTLGLVAHTNAKDLTIAGVVFQQDQFFRTIQMGMNAAPRKAQLC